MDDDDDEELGRHYGRLDLDRVGFFDDPPPGPFAPYAAKPRFDGLRSNLLKGPQISCNKHGDFFEGDFHRLFIGEVMVDRPVKSKKKPGGKVPEEIRPKLLRPPGGTKWHSTPDDWYGCLGPQPKAFSPVTKPPPERPERIPPNCKIKPNPLGGPGYADICLSPYQRVYLKAEPYDPVFPKETADDPRRRFYHNVQPKKFFTENPYSTSMVSLPASETSLLKKKKTKKTTYGTSHLLFHRYFPRAPLGPNSGCFDSFPKYRPDPYDEKPDKKKKKKDFFVVTDRWVPSGPDLRSKFTTSIIEKITNVACHANNFTSYREQVYPLK